MEKNIANLLKAIAHPIRIKIVRIIFEHHSLSVSSIHTLLNIDQDEVSFTDPLDTSTSSIVTTMDVQSSIWYNIYPELIAKYNNFYNNTVLNNTYIEDSIGAEMKRHKDYIDGESSFIILCISFDASA